MTHSAPTGAWSAFLSFARCVLCGALLTGTALEVAAAEDTVILQSAGAGRARSRFTGQVLEYNGRELHLQRSGGRVEQFPAERVLEVQTPRLASHEAADEHFDAQRFDQALIQYRQAAGEETRRWLRRRILARQAWCYHQLGQDEQAGATFLLVAQDDPALLDLAFLPLAWRTGQPSPALEQAAARWVRQSDSPAAQLLGASWLLASSDRSTATSMLQQLAREAPDTRIALLAETQLWRTRIVTASAEDVRRWEAQLARLPEPLRAGPSYVLGMVYARLGATDQAALTFLRVPVLHPAHHQLAGECLLQAARQLEKGGHADESLSLYRELLVRHSGSLAAREAQAALDAASSKP